MRSSRQVASKYLLGGGMKCEAFIFTPKNGTEKQLCDGGQGANS